MAENDTEKGKKSVHHLIPFLIPFALALVGNADALLVVSMEWGRAHAELLMSVSLGAWASVSFLMYRKFTKPETRPSVLSRFLYVCVFAFFTGALCAFDTSSGFVFFEALFGAAIITSCCMEAIGFTLTHVPVRILWIAVAQAVGIMSALIISDARLSAVGALLALLFALLLFSFGAGGTRTDRTG